jgi:hypothetical protein
LITKHQRGNKAGSKPCGGRVDGRGWETQIEPSRLKPKAGSAPNWLFFFLGRGSLPLHQASIGSACWSPVDAPPSTAPLIEQGNLCRSWVETIFEKGGYVRKDKHKSYTTLIILVFFSEDLFQRRGAVDTCFDILALTVYLIQACNLTLLPI